MSQYAELKAQIAKLQAQADDARRQEVVNVIAEMKQKIAEFGLGASDLGFAGGRPRRGAAAPRRRKPRCPRSTKTPSPAIRGAGGANRPSGLPARTGIAS